MSSNPAPPADPFTRGLAAAAPYLLVLVPLCFTAQRNLDSVDPAIVAILALTAVIFTALALLLLRVIFPAPGAGQLWLAAAYAGLLCFPVFRTAAGQLTPPVPPATTAALFVLLAVALLALFGRALRRKIAPASSGSAIMGVCAAGLLAWQALTAWQTVAARDEYRTTCHSFTTPAGDELQHRPAAAQAPDICLILLDEYARVDTLQRLFQFDNQPFQAELRRRGFTITPGAYTNYDQTQLILAGMFNLDYLPPLPDRYNHWAATEMIRHSRLLALLRARGYLIRDCSGGYAGISLEPPTLTANLFHHHQDFLFALLGLTPVPALADRLLFPRTLAGSGIRALSRAAFARAAQPPDPDRPTFTFLHSVITHQPLVFMADGSWPVEPELSVGTFAKRYSSALEYSNAQVLQLVDRIQAGAVRPQVILIQADHGSGSGLDWESLERSDLPERFGVLSAVYYADGAAHRGPPAKSPVNLFRGVLNDWLGGDYPPLPDRAFYSTWSNPYRLTDVTDSVASPCSGQSGATAPASVR